MNILLATSFFPPTHTGGTENYTLAIARGLLAAGHHVQVICVGRWAEGDHYWNGFTDEIYNDVPVRRLHLNWEKAPNPNRYLYDNPIVATQVSDYLHQIQPEVVHITSCNTLTASVIRSVKNAGLPVVLTLTDFWFVCPRLTLLRSDGTICNGQVTASDCHECMLNSGRLYRSAKQVLPRTLARHLFTTFSRFSLLSRQRGLRGFALNMSERRSMLPAMLNQVDYIISPSRFLANMFATTGQSCAIHILPHGNDLSWLANYCHHDVSSPLRIGYMGQILPIKGVHVLIEAFRELADHPEIQLSIFGPLDPHSSYGQHLQNMAAGDSRIRFGGRFGRESLGSILADLDVLVFPSLWYENNPLVIQEAFAAQVPVVASNLGAIPEHIQAEINGLLFEPGNAKDLARVLRRILVEPGIIEQLRKGIPQVNRIETEVVELCQIYEQFVKSNNTLPAEFPQDTQVLTQQQIIC